jgi:hypothetical protein
MATSSAAAEFRKMKRRSKITKRPWTPDDRIRIPLDSAIWADPEREVQFVVEPGISMPWIMKGPAVTLSTRSLAHANSAAVREAERYNERYPGKATAVTIPEDD